jgi:Rieske Fe-S protein
MKTLILSFLMLAVAVWSPLLIADDYPSSYIAKQLADAQKPIEVYVSNMEHGQLIAVDYVDRPVWVYRRTAKDIKYLSNTDNSHLADPKSENLTASIEASYGSSSSYVWARMLLVDQPELEKLPFRSRKAQFFVVGGWSPHSGCALSLAAPGKRGPEEVVFYDSCVGASFDGAGRILKGKLTGNAVGVSATYNMYIPPYRFKDDKTLIIGLRDGKELPEFPSSKERRYLRMTPTEKLISAARYDDLDTVRLALKEGADAGYYAVGKGSPLDAAIIGSSMEVIELLIANGARPTPNSLNAANFVGRSEVVELIKDMQ